MAKKAKGKTTRKALKPKDLAARRSADSVKGGAVGPCDVRRQLK